MEHEGRLTCRKEALYIQISNRGWSPVKGWGNTLAVNMVK